MSIVRISVSARPKIRPSGPVAIVSPSVAPQRDGRERANREDVAVGEVDQLDDPVDERVADCDQRPDGAVRQPLQQVEAELGKIVVDDRVSVEQPDLVPVDQVMQAVVDRQRQQRDDQAPDSHAGPHELQGPGSAGAHRLECCGCRQALPSRKGTGRALQAPAPSPLRPAQAQEALRYFVGCSVL